MSTYLKFIYLCCLVVVISTVGACTAETDIGSCPDNKVLAVQSYKEDFEDASIDLGTTPPTLSFGSQSETVNTNADFSNNPDAIAVIIDPSLARAGNGLVKFTLLAGDFVAGGNRTELSFRKLQNPECSEGYYAWGFRLDSMFEETGDFNTLGSWHAQPLNGQTSNSNNSNPIYQTYKQGELLLHNRPPPDYLGVVQASRPIPKGTWVDVVYHVKWSQHNDGFVEAWYRVVPDVNNAGAYERLTDFNPDKGDYKIYGKTIANSASNYLKLGLYRSTNTDPTGRTTGVIYYDEVRIGNSFDEVAIL